MLKSALVKRPSGAYNKNVEKMRGKERDMDMMEKWMKGDLDDMIFGDSDWQPSER